MKDAIYVFLFVCFVVWSCFSTLGWYLEKQESEMLWLAGFNAAIELDAEQQLRAEFMRLPEGQGRGATWLDERAVNAILGAGDAIDWQTIELYRTRSK